MGLTSSQGRLLMLTSRLSDIQLDEMLIAQRQQQLAWHSEKVAKEYNDKVDNMKLVMKVNDSSEMLGYRKTDMTYSDMTSMGYLVTDAKGRIYLTKEEDEWVIPTAVNKGNANIFDGEVETDENGNETISLKGQKYPVVDGTEVLLNKEKLQKQLMNGLLFVLNTDQPLTGDNEINNLEANTGWEWVQDTSDDAEAESKYNYETVRISRQDSQLDLELKQLETQHNAIIKEIESVEKVIDDNIERTFKLFSGG